MMKNLNMKLEYLKYYEEYLLKPHRNYEERELLLFQKINNILIKNQNINELDLTILPDKYQRKIIDLKNLISVKSLKLYDNKYLKTLKPLTNLVNLYAGDSNIEDLGYIRNFFSIRLNGNKKIKTLGKYIFSSSIIYLDETNIENLGTLTHCHSNLYLNDTKNIKSLYPLSFAKFIDLRDSNVEDISSLKTKCELYISEDSKIPFEDYNKHKTKIFVK